MRSLSMIALLALVFAAAAPAQNLLSDPGFESGGFSAGWTPFGNSQIVITNPPADVPRTGMFASKMFGNFSGGFDVTGAFEQFPCNAGDTFTLDCWSRHYSGDPLIGMGATNMTDNWCVMKIAFFDAMGAEIVAAAAEQIILDGTSPTDTWIDNTPVSATAPMNAVNVQALILFLQPNNDGGAGYFDDVEFTVATPPATYAGTGDDLAMTTGINAAPDSTDVKNATGGDILTINTASPGGALDFLSYFLLGQVLPTGGLVTVPGLPELWLDLTLPIFVLVDPLAPGPLGGQLITPGGGNSGSYLVPPFGAGVSISLQALVTNSATNNGIYATSDAHEIVLN